MLISYLTMFQKLSTQKKIGAILIISCAFINQYVWLEFFDSDGFLKPVSKLRILFVDLLLLTVGLSLFFLKFNYKNLLKKLILVKIFMYQKIILTHLNLLKAGHSGQADLLIFLARKDVGKLI